MGSNCAYYVWAPACDGFLTGQVCRGVGGKKKVGAGFRIPASEIPDWLLVLEALMPQWV